MTRQLINISVTDPGAPNRLHMVQYDSNSREIATTLWENGVAFVVPSGAAAMLRYKKPDGMCGLYDTDSHGNAVTISGNTVTIPVDDQVLTVPGEVFSEVDIFGANSARIATFKFSIMVSDAVCPDSSITSTSYFNILTQQIANAIAAATNAASSSTLSESWAVGGTGTRAGEDTNNSKYWAEQSALESQNSIKYTPQTLTELQKQQARTNIGSDVTSVFGRIGDVVVASGDYNGAQIPLTGYIKPASGGDIAPADSVNSALGKLEEGKAPSGYGLGEIYGKRIDDTDLNTLFKNGIYSIGTGCTNTPYGATSAYSSLIITSSRAKTQIYIPANDTANPSTYSSYITRMYVDDVGWKPWEWINPPMTVGVEYRTTERHMGKPVYTKLLDFGVMPNNTDKFAAYQTSGIVDKIIRVNGTCYSPSGSAITIPMQNRSFFVGVVAGLESVQVSTNTDMSEYPSSYVTIYYTKKSD